MRDLITNKPYHHQDIDLLDQVIAQIIEDKTQGDLTAIEVLLDYIPREALRAYLPEEEAGS